MVGVYERHVLMLRRRRCDRVCRRIWIANVDIDVEVLDVGIVLPCIGIIHWQRGVRIGLLQRWRCAWVLGDGAGRRI